MLLILFFPPPRVCFASDVPTPAPSPSLQWMCFDACPVHAYTPHNPLNLPWPCFLLLSWACCQ